MSIKKTTIGIAVAILAGTTLNAAAATLDFAAFTDTIAGEQGIEATVTSFLGDGGGAKAIIDLSNPFSVGGVMLSATGWDDSFTNAANYAYLDQGNAGLGVCGAVVSGTGQCANGADDNITAGEGLRLTFEEDWTIDKIFFRNQSHGTTFLAGSEVNINGFNYGLVHELALGLDLTAGQALDLKYGTGLGGGDEMYISAVLVSSMTPISSVPLPSSVLMLFSAVAGLGFASRKRRAA